MCLIQRVFPQQNLKKGLMPSRAVVLGTNAYPYLMKYWLHLFETVWEVEVDKVYIAVSQPIHPSVWAFTSSMLSKHKKIEVFNTGVNWPGSIEQVLGQVTERHVMIPHDDLFVFEKGIVDKMFRVAENEDKIVTPIHPNYTSPAIVQELMQKKWGHQLPFVEEGTGQTGYSFFCNFFFAPMKLLMKTNMDFGAMHIKKGSYDKLLDWTFLTQDIHADTNFKLGLELLDIGAQFYCPREIDFKRFLPISTNPVRGLNKLKKVKGGLFDKPYLHLQTFSYHLEGLLPDVGFYEQAEFTRYGTKGKNKINHVIDNVPVNQSSKHDVMIKIGAIKAFMTLGDWVAIEKYHQHTLREFDHIMKYMGIKESEMKKLVSLFHQLLIDRSNR